MADGDALHIARTKASSAVGVRRHSKKLGEPCIGPAFTGVFWALPRSTKGWRPFRTLQPRNGIELLQFDLGAGIFQLLFGSVGVGLVHAFLDGLGSAVDQVLGFL